MRPFAHLYIHVPFCRHKCGYCDFNAYAGMDRLMERYQGALELELEGARERLPFVPLRTVYFGGGTPSLLPSELAARMLAHVRKTFELEPDAEVTLEANPASTDQEKLDCWRRGGVNRLSLGVQGFDPAALAVLERRSDGRQAVRAFRAAKAACFDNISLDLIYAVPLQTTRAWLDTLQRALALGPDHLSCYCLGFEEGTLLHRRRERGLLPEVDPDQAWAQLNRPTASWPPPASSATRSPAGLARAADLSTTRPTGPAARCTVPERAPIPMPPTRIAPGAGGTSPGPETI